MPKPHTLICTLGTSLFGNLRRLAEAQQSDPDREALAKAYSGRDWAEVASHLVKIAPSEQVCGAEINSVEILASDKVERVNLHLLHSDTDDGRAIAGILQSYFKAHGWHNVSCHTLDGLRDDDPNLFRTQGLRNLAKKCGELVRFAGGAEFCAINATGGYKAQIAIAVLIGQALDIPVYYKHEFFRTDAIISFPPMPVALDFSLWERASGMFMALSRANAFEPWQHFEDDWDERFEPLVDRVDVDGAEYLELSPAGQIFHETFLQRFQQFKTERLPPAAAPGDKRDPRLGDHAYRQARVPIENFLGRITWEAPYVLSCRTTYWDPRLATTTMFRLSSHGIEGVYSNGTWSVKFAVETTAGQDSPTDSLNVIVADLNVRLAQLL